MTVLRLFTMLLVGIFLGGLGGCGSDGDSSTENSSAGASGRTNDQPSVSEVEAFVRKEFGSQLTTKSFIDRSMPGMMPPPPGMGPGFGGPPGIGGPGPGMASRPGGNSNREATPPEGYQPPAGTRVVSESFTEPTPPPRSFGANDPLDQYLAEASQPREFEISAPRLELTTSLSDHDVPVELTGVKIEKPKEFPGEVRFDFTAKQKLNVDLYKLASSYKFKQAIGWDDKPLRDAASIARKLPPEFQQELIDSWKAIRPAYGHVMELDAKAGTEYAVEGTVSAKQGGDGWVMTIVEQNIRKPPRGTLVPEGKTPPGLMRVDPQSYQTSAEEWAKPLNAFVAEVEKTQAKADEADSARMERQLAKLKDFTQPGQSWTTRVKTDNRTATVFLTFKEVEDEGRVKARFHIPEANDGGGIEVRGYPAKYYDFMAEESGASVPREVRGHVYRIVGTGADHPDQELEFFLAVGPREDAPIMIWDRYVNQMQRAE